MALLPKHASFNQEDIMTEVGSHAYYSKEHRTYYFKVIEEQFDTNTVRVDIDNLIDAYDYDKSKWETVIKKIIGLMMIFPA